MKRLLLISLVFYFAGCNKTEGNGIQTKGPSSSVHSGLSFSLHRGLRYEDLVEKFKNLSAEVVALANSIKEQSVATGPIPSSTISPEAQYEDLVQSFKEQIDKAKQDPKDENSQIQEPPLTCCLFTLL